MDKIYKTTYGACIDLSQIISIEPIRINKLISINKSQRTYVISSVEINTHNRTEPIKLQIKSNKCQSLDEYADRNEEAFEDLIRAWKDYANYNELDKDTIEPAYSDLCPICYCEMDRGVCINTQCLINND